MGLRGVFGAVTCVGVPLSHVRDLTEADRVALRMRAARLRRRRIALGVGTALVPMLIFVPLALSLVVSWAPVTMLFFMPLCVRLPLLWLDARKRAAVASASARATEAQVFEGIPDAGAGVEVSLAAMIGVGFVADGATPQRIDRIEASGEAIAVNGVAIAPPIWTDVAEVAPASPPEEAFPARVPDFAFDSPEHGRRALSAAEIAELRRLHPERNSMRQNGCLLAFCAYFFLFSFTAPDDTPALRWAVLALRAVALLYVGWRVAQAARERTLLRRDVAEGSVVRVEAAAGKALEVLPRLRLVWTVDGEPAPWRHAAQAKPRPPV